MSASLLSLPDGARGLMFKEFQEASTAGDIKHLNSAVSGWLDTADMYAGSELNMALKSSEGFRVIHARLLDLLQADEEEVEQAFPSSHAFNTALSLLLGARLRLGDLPRANVTADEAGGVRVQWMSPERQVRLIVPAEDGGRLYLYSEAGSEYALEDNPSHTYLAERLRWFADPTSGFGSLTTASL